MFERQRVVKYLQPEPNGLEGRDAENVRYGDTRVGDQAGRGGQIVYVVIVVFGRDTGKYTRLAEYVSSEPEGKTKKCLP